jgi:hypothetical protein
MAASTAPARQLVLFADIDGTLVHYPDPSSLAQVRSLTRGGSSTDQRCCMQGSVSTPQPPPNPPLLPPPSSPTAAGAHRRRPRAAALHDRPRGGYTFADRLCRLCQTSAQPPPLKSPFPAHDQPKRPAPPLPRPARAPARHQGVISRRTLELCAVLRGCGARLAIVSGARTSTLLGRLPYLPAADAYVSENGGRIFYPDPAGSTGGRVRVRACVAHAVGWGRLTAARRQRAPAAPAAVVGQQTSYVGVYQPPTAAPRPPPPQPPLCARTLSGGRCWRR